jgi:hypothetical protein
MALTYVQYTGDGVTKQYTLSFPYLSKDHVYVRVNSENKTFTWLNDSTVVLDDAPASGASIMIYRNTPKDDYLVKFKAGTGFREQDLNMMTTQVFYVVQETMENVDVEDLYMWRTEALDAKNTAVSAKNEAVSAKDIVVGLASDLSEARDVVVEARDIVTTARDETVTAKGAAVTAAGEALSSRLIASEAASTAMSSADIATTKALEAISAAGIASEKAQEASADAQLAEASAQLAFGAEAEAWNPDKVYNYPDVVAYTDGHTYRCTGTDIIGYEQAPGLGAFNWQRITVEMGRQFFEHDENGDYMPALNPFAHDGVDGNSLLVGYGDPTTGLGKIGDTYIDRSTWNFWEKREASRWENTGNIGGNNTPSTYIHQQNTASAEWYILHNLNKKPTVTIVSSSGEVVLGKVVYLSPDALTIYFRAPFSGEAYLN